MARPCGRSFIYGLGLSIYKLIYISGDLRLVPPPVARLDIAALDAVKKWVLVCSGSRYSVYSLYQYKSTCFTKHRYTNTDT